MLVGWVVDGFGCLIDGKGEMKIIDSCLLELLVLGIIDCCFVYEFM